jgi:hypothetical protein
MPRAEGATLRGKREREREREREIEKAKQQI